MTEHPILFSGPMVRPVLNCKPGVWPAEPINPALPFKWQTRRVIRPQPWEPWEYLKRLLYIGGRDKPVKCPYGQPGDRLWVRETHLRNGDYSDAPYSFYPDILYADEEDYDICYPLKNEKKGGINWRVIPSIHMPRWASRITLEVVDVRVERVQEITWQDALAEGIEYDLCCNGADCSCRGLPIDNPIPDFQLLWDSLNAKRGYGWDTNCWVWVITFKVLP